MIFKKKTLASTGLALAFGLCASAANAADIDSLIFPNELNQFSDNSAESQNVDLNGNGLLDVGDTLRGILDIGTIEDLSGGGGTRAIGGTGVDSTGNNELTAIFEAEILTITGERLDPLGNAIADFTFGPNAAFISEFGLTAGTMVFSLRILFLILPARFRYCRYESCNGGTTGHQWFSGN